MIDHRAWQIPLGRRLRALKLWFVLRHFGAAGLREHIRRGVALAAAFAEWVDADPAFERVAPAPLNLVCFRHTGGDEVNQRLLDALNASGRIYLTHARLDGRLVLRLALGGTRTRLPHVERAWRLIREIADQVA